MRRETAGSYVNIKFMPNYPKMKGWVIAAAVCGWNHSAIFTLDCLIDAKDKSDLRDLTAAAEEGKGERE